MIDIKLNNKPKPKLVFSISHNKCIYYKYKEITKKTIGCMIIFNEF